MADDKELATQSFVSMALSRQIVICALKVSLVVGTVLAFINHGDKILAMTLDAKNLCQILLTYMVPYCVSTWSAVKAIKSNAGNKH